MGLLFKKALTLMLMIGYSICAQGEENISTLVSTLSDPKTVAPVVHETMQEESDDDAKTSIKPEESTERDTEDDDEQKIEASEEDEKERDADDAKKVSDVRPVVPISVKSVEAKEPKDAVEKRVESIVPEVPKVMPRVPVSPVKPVDDEIEKSDTASKIIHTSYPTVSKSVTSPIQIVDISDTDLDKGLDTLNVDSSGNWLEKRIWYQKAEQLFEVIRKNLQQSADLRMKFVHEVNQVGHSIDAFYENINFEKGEIDEMLTAVLQDLSNQEEIRGGDLSSSERSIKSKVQVEQKHFEVLSKDLKLIEDLDDQIDKTMMKAFKEIDTCRGLETRAWNNFKEIGLELDDKKARVLYYEMENFHKNIEQKMHYLQSNLFPYLHHQLVSKVDETISKIKSAIQIFDSKGLSLTNVLKKDEKGDLLILKKRDEMKAAETEPVKEVVPKKVKEVTPSSWYEKVWHSIISFIHPVFCKLQELLCVVICFGQSVFCNILQWICRLFGY